MLKRIRQLWNQESSSSDNGRDRSAQRMEMFVEPLECRMMLSGVALSNDATEVVEPVVASVAPTSEAVSATSESTTELAADPQLIVTGDVQTIVLNVNDDLNISVSETLADASSDSETYVENNDVDSIVEDVVLVTPIVTETELETTQESDIEQINEEAVRVTSSVARTAALTAPDHDENNVSLRPILGPATSDQTSSFQFLSGHETRGPPAMESDLTSDTVLIAPLSSNSTNTDSCVDLSCPCQDGSDALCNDRRLVAPLPEVASDYEITAFETQLLDLFDQLRLVRPDLTQLPFDLPASFDFAGLIDGFDSVLNLRPAAEQYFDLVEAFQLDINTQLNEFRTLLGLPADFDDTTGDTATNTDLQLLADELTSRFRIELPTGDLTFADLQVAVVAEVGSFASSLRLISYVQEAIDTIDLSPAGMAFSVVLSGGYFSDADELRFDLALEYSGTATFTDVALADLSAVIGGALNDIKNSPAFLEFTGITEDLTSAVLAIEPINIDDLPVGAADPNFADVAFTFNGQLAAAVGFNLNGFSTGDTVTNEMAFLRLTQLDTNATLSLANLTLIVDFGSIQSIGFDLASISATIGTSWTGAAEVTLATLIAGTESVDSIIAAILFDPTGSTTGQLPLNADSTIEGFDEVEFGQAVFIINDASLFDDQPMNVDVSVGVGASIQGLLLSLTEQWDSLLDSFSNTPLLATVVPLLGEQASNLIAGPGANGIDGLLGLNGALSNYFTAAGGNATIDGAVNALTSALNGALVGVSSLPIDISGRFSLVAQEIVFDLGVNLEQSYSQPIDFIDLLDDLGPMANILSELTALGIDLTGNFVLDVTTYLTALVSLRIDLADLFDVNTPAPSDNDLYITIAQPLVAGATVSANELNLGVSFNTGSTSYAPQIQDGTIEIGVEAQLALAAATGGIVSVPQIVAGPISDLIETSFTGTLASNLPIVGLFDPISEIDGTFVLRVIDEALFDLSATPTTIIDFQVSVSDFAYIRGSIAGFVATTVMATLEDGSTKEVDLLTVGIGDADLFLGIGGPTQIDLDGNGMVDEDELNSDSTGFLVTGAYLGLALLAPTDGMDNNIYLAISASAATVAPVGLPSEFELTLNNLNFSYNFGSDQVVDFAASDFDDDGSADGGLIVATGADPVTLDMTDAVLRAETDATLILGDFVFVTGTFAIAAGVNGDVVVDDSGVTRAVSVLTIGAANVDIFIGAMKADRSGLEAGIQMTGTSFGIALMSTTDPAVNALYFAMKATAEFVAPVGLPPEISIEARNVELSINGGTDGNAVNFTHANTMFGGNPGPLAVDTGAEDGTGDAITVDLDFTAALFEASAFLILGLGDNVFVDGYFAFGVGPAQAVTLSDGTEKQVASFTIGGANATVFLGIGGPYRTDTNNDGVIDANDAGPNAAAKGFVLTGVDFGLVVAASLEAGDSSFYFALQATVGSTAIVGLPDIAIGSGLVTIRMNLSTDPTGAVIDFANSGFDGSDEDTDPDGFLEIKTGAELVELSLSESLVGIAVDAASVTITESGTDHTFSGNFAFEISQDIGGNDQFVVAVSDLTYSGVDNAIKNAIGVMVLKDTGVALLVYGEFDASAGVGVSIDAGLGLIVNTTGGVVNETIIVGGRELTIDSTIDEIRFVINNLSINIADFVFIEGTFTITQGIVLGTGEMGTFSGGAVEIFMGLGPYKLPNGDVNPDAVGVLVTNAVVGMIELNGIDGYAVWAEGDVQFVGVDGLTVTGTVRVEVNTTGVAIVQSHDVEDIDGNVIGTAAFNFATTDEVKRMRGTDIAIGIPGVFELNVNDADGGYIEFSKLPNGMVEIDIAFMDLRLMPTSPTEEQFKVTAHGTYTISKDDGFKLRFIQVVDFSIFGHDAGIQTGTDPPPAELALALGFPTIVVGAGGQPTAALVNPLSGATLDVVSLNSRQFIDITFSVGTTDILDAGAEFTLSGDGVTADLMIDNANVEHLYGNTYRYYLLDADPTNDVGLFVIADGNTTATVTVNFIAGSFRNSVTTSTNAASTDSFTLEDGAGTATSGLTFSVGPIQIVGPTFGIDDFSYTNGTLLLTIGIGAGQINFGFGDGQDNSGVTAQLTNVLLTFDVELGFDLSDPVAFIADPLAHVSGPSLTGKFSIRAQMLTLVIPDILEVTAEGILLAYDPAIEGTQTLLTVDETEIFFPAFNLTGTIEDLAIRTDGFSFGDAELEWNADPGMPLRMGGLFEFYSFGVGISDFDITFGQAFVFAGSITFFTDAATFLPGQAIEATVSQAPGSTQHGLSATLNFDETGNLDSLQFHIDQIEIKFGQLVTFVGSDIDIDSGAWGDANMQLVSIGSIGASVRLGNLVIGGAAQNFAFMGDGSFLALTDFAVIISADSVDGGGIGWPSWMPIQITKVGIVWEDVNTDPGDFDLIISARVVGLHNLPVNIGGIINDIRIDVPKLLAGEMPVVDIGAAVLSIDGPMFGGNLAGSIIFGILKVDANGDILEQPFDESDVVERIFYGAIDVEYETPAMTGIRLQMAVSELGPVSVVLSASTATGILLEPVTGLTINEFFGGVQFYRSVSDDLMDATIDDPFDLRGITFNPLDVDLDEWLNDTQEAVVAQYLDPMSEDFTSAFESTMTIVAGAKLYSNKTSEYIFNGDVVIKFSTDGQFAAQGKLNFFTNPVSDEALLTATATIYGDLTRVDEGDFAFYFLADAPDNPVILTYYGELTFEFIPTSDPLAPNLVIELQGGMIVNAPVGFLANLAGVEANDVELFSIEGKVRLAFDSSRPAFILDVDGTMSMAFLGTVGSVSGRLVLELPTTLSPTDPPRLWGVLRMEPGLDKLAQLGLEVNGEVMLQVNTTNDQKIEVLALTGIVGDDLITLTDANVLAHLDALSPVVPPASLPALSPLLRAFLTGLAVDVDLDSSNGMQGITLSGNVTIDVVVTGSKWRVYDEDNDAYFFIRENADGSLTVSGEAQEFTLEARTFMIEIQGELIFHLPAFEADGVTPGPDVFVLSGGAFLKINEDGVQAFVLGHVTVGPGDAPILEFEGQGILVITQDGIAAGLSLELSRNFVTGTRFTGQFSFILNTTNGQQSFAIPQRFLDSLLPAAPPIPAGAEDGDLIPASPNNTTLFWEVGDNETTLTPVLVVPGEAPDVNGNFVQNATNTPYVVILGQADLTIQRLGVDLMTLSGRFHITLEPNRLAVLAAFSTAVPVLGAATGTASFVLDNDGMYGLAEVTLSVGAAIPGLDVSLSLLLEFNTSDVAKDIQTFEVDKTTGTIGTTAITVSLAARQIRIVAGGSLSVRNGSDVYVSLIGRFEMYVNTSELAISVAARLSLADGTIAGVDVTGAALIASDGIAFQILAETNLSTSDSFAGGGFRIELGGSATIGINTTNRTITEIAGVQVNLAPNSFGYSLAGAGLIEFSIAGVGGFRIEGQIVQSTSTTEFLIAVDGEFTATLGGTVLLRMAATGTFQIFGATAFNDIGADDGIAGKIALTVGSSSLLSGTGFDLAGTFTLEVNTTNNAVTEIGGVAVNLDAGPYARVFVSGVIRFSFGGAASFELRADGAGQGFTFEMNETRIAITADADLVAVVGGSTLLSLSVNNGLLAISTDGIVANIELGGSIGGNLFGFSGTTKFKLNTTNESVFINGGVVLPGVHISIVGSLTLLSGFQLNGQFAIELNSNGLVVDANADLSVTVGGTQLVSLELIDSFLQISDRGIAARLSVGGRFTGPGFEFRSSTVMTLLVNTTGLHVDRVNGRSVSLGAGYYAQLSLVGDLALLNAVTIKGNFTVRVASDGLDVSMNATLSVMDIGFRINAAARIRSQGIAFRAGISLAAGGNELRPISGLSIRGNFELHINTMSTSQLGLNPHSAALQVNGSLNVRGFTIASIQFGVSIYEGGFDANFAGTLDVGILDVNVSGSFSSSGAFSLSGSVGFSISAGPAYLNGSASVTISNTDGFRMSVSGSAGIRVAGINVGVSVGGSVSVAPNGSMTIRAEACVRINLVFSSFSVCAGVTFSFGRRPAADPSGTNTTAPPSLGTVSSGTLNLNLSQFGNGNRNISITDDGGGNIRVSGNGYTQVFGGVNFIDLNLGNGNDYLYIDSGISANVRINGGNGDDEIIYLGSGSAEINGGNGNDEIRVINDRNFRAEPTDGGLPLPLLFGLPPGHTLTGGDGDDILIGGGGNDTISGGNGNDRLDGGGGADLIRGGEGLDIIYGGSGADDLRGDGGNDVLYGEAGNDSLDGGFGDDILLGGSGDETIYWTFGQGDDIEINGQSDNDEIVFIGTTANNTILANPGDDGAFIITVDGQEAPVTNFEIATIRGLTGLDDIIVNDLSTTTITKVNIELGDDVVRDLVTINGLPGNDEYTMTVAGSNVTITPLGGAPIEIIEADDSKGGADITLNTGEGNDIVNIAQSLVGTLTTINTDVGDDVINVGGAITALTAIAGGLTINGAEHDDTLNITAAADTAGVIATFNANTIVSTTIPAGLITFNDFELVDVVLGSGNDELTVTALLEQTTMSLAGAAGDDLFIIGAAVAGGRSLANIDGIFTLDGQADNDMIVIDNSADANANNVTVASDEVVFTIVDATVGYDNFEVVTVNTGSAGDQVTVESTHTGSTTVNSGAGSDTLDIRTIDGFTTLNTSDDNDTINVGDAAPVAGSTLDSILQLLVVNAGNGSDTLNVDDSGDTSNNVGLLTATTLSGLDMSHGIAYADFETVNLDLGSGNDTLTIQSTSVATNTIDLAAGNDTLLIESISGTTTVYGRAGNDAMTVGIDGLLDNISALLTLDGNEDTNSLTISDAADAASNLGSLNATMLRGLGMSHGIDYFAFASAEPHALVVAMTTSLSRRLTPTRQR